MRLVKNHINLGVLLALWLSFAVQAWGAELKYFEPTPDRDALQNEINAIGSGTIYLRAATYDHNGLVLRKSVTIKGDGWDWDGGTVLFNFGTGPNITIINPDMTGAKITDVMLTGNGDGVWVEGQGNNLIERVYIIGQRGRGIVFSPFNHSTMTSIIGCRIQRCEGDAIYGRTNPPAAEVNAITIRGNHIIQNKGHGVNVFAKGLWVAENIIQNNVGAAFFAPSNFSAFDVMMLKQHNYFEANGNEIVFGE